MGQAVTVRLSSRQRLEDGEERFSQEALGVLSETAEGLTLRYQEESGETLLRFSGDALELRRPGTRLVFRAGETCPGRYATPCGTAALSVRTDYLRHSMTPAGGRALLRYTLLSGGSSLGAFTLTLRVTGRGR